MSSEQSPTKPNRRGVIGVFVGAGAVSGLGQDAALGGRALRPRALLDVMHFGATGDGIADDTAAFVAALSAARQDNREHNGVSIPPGTFRVDGPVAIRPGQSLIGSGYATLIDARKATGPVFVCSNSDAPDAGTPPVTIRALRGLGGVSGAAFVCVNLAGFSLSDMFLSAPGIGIQIDGGADGIISNIQIDQGLNGLVVHNSQNLVMSSILMFNVHFGLTLSGNCADIALSGSQFSYAQYASILAADGACIRGMAINGCAFTSNEQRETFIGHFHCRATEASASFNACSFRNWRGFAVRQGVRAGVHLDFSNCSFDGLRSNVAYNQSLDAGVIECGEGGAYSFSACQFRDLQGPIAAFGSGPAGISILHGSVIRSHRTIVKSAESSQTKLTMTRLDGVAIIDGHVIVLPIWPTWAGWRLNVSGSVLGQQGLDCELIILPNSLDAAHVLTLWSSAATFASISALIVRDTVRVDLAKYGMAIVEASASTLP